MNLRVFFFLLLSACIQSFVLGSEPAKISSRIVGKIVDLTGHPMSNVSVQLKQDGFATSTDDHGRYQLMSRSVERKIRAEDMFQSDGQKLAFHVLTIHARVRITVFDFTGHELGRVVDEDLKRGLYGLAPLSSLRHELHIGVYGIRLQIGSLSYYHRIPYFGKKTDRTPLRLVPLPLDQIAKVAATTIDTLVISKIGFRTIQQVVVVEDDTIPSMVMTSDSLTSWTTDDSAYLKAVEPGVAITPLLTVGESVPMTDNFLQGFRMGGMPNGLGLTTRDSQTARLFMSHEISSQDSINALVAGPTKKGAYVSEYTIDRATDRIVSGRFAFESVHALGNFSATPGFFNRLSPGFLAGPEEGITLPIYLTGESSSSSSNFSSSGAQTLGIVGDKAFILSDFGKLAFQSLTVVPTQDSNQTVVMALEQTQSGRGRLYLYIGRKLRDMRSPDPLYENGLAGGKLYVFAASGKHNEAEFNSGTLQGHWVDLLRNRPDAPFSLADISTATLNGWSTVSADGKDTSFNFESLAEGAYDPSQKGAFYFSSTGNGSASQNRFGRIYKLSFDPKNALEGEGPRLEILATGDSITGFTNPGKIAIGKTRNMVICEKPSASILRPPAIWMLNLEARKLDKLAVVDAPSSIGTLRPGLKTQWEVKGLIDGSNQLGIGTWLLNVQARSITSENAAGLQNLPEGTKPGPGGQLLLLRIAPK